MGGIRKPFQGLRNIVSFNWHYYALSAAVLAIILALQFYFTGLSVAAGVLMLAIGGVNLVSLAVSCYVYDFSGFYNLNWLDDLISGEKERLINIHAGFDETSDLLQRKFSNSELQVFDFYNPSRHTEVSIRRARRQYPAFPDTVEVSTCALPLEDKSADKVFTILSAHEIRTDEERIAFFKEIARILKPFGKLVVTEHLRDTPNFLAYNIGFLHFHSKATWQQTFKRSGFSITRTIKTTPFITTFILEKNGTSA